MEFRSHHLAGIVQFEAAGQLLPPWRTRELECFGTPSFFHILDACTIKRKVAGGQAMWQSSVKTEGFAVKGTFIEADDCQYISMKPIS